MSERPTITPWEKNPRRITKQRLKDLRENMGRYGDLGGIVVNVRTWESLSGNQRCRAIDINGCDRHIVERFDPPTAQGTVAIGFIDFEGERFSYREVDWDQQTMEDAAITANVSAGDWDFDALAEGFDVGRLMGLGMEGLLPDDFLDRSTADRQEREGRDEPETIDHHAELRKKWGTEPGQLWVIPSESCPEKSHRLLIGDSTSAEDVQRLMQGERAHLFATDPPYLVDYTGTNHPDAEREVQEWEKWDTIEDGAQFFDDFLRAATEHALRPDAAWYCWHASSKQALVEEAWKRAGAFVHQQIIWSKRNAVLTRSFYMWAHEPCFYGWTKGKMPPRRSKEHLSTVWHIDEIPNSRESLHPTSKPIRLFQIPIEQHTRTGEICYEPFSGSGSQHVAAETLGRLCYGMERAPEYAAVILERLEKMGLTPRLEEGE